MVLFFPCPQTYFCYNIRMLQKLDREIHDLLYIVLTFPLLAIFFAGAAIAASETFNLFDCNFVFVFRKPQSISAARLRVLSALARIAFLNIGKSGEMCLHWPHHTHLFGHNILESCTLKNSNAISSSICQFSRWTNATCHWHWFKLLTEFVFSLKAKNSRKKMEF